VNFRSPRKRRREVLLDITPLIDVVFLLLIFFLITSTFVRHSEMIVSIGLNLPEGVADALPEETERITLFVGDDGEVSMSVGDDPEHPVSDEALRIELDTLYQTNHQLSIYLRGDRGVDYGRMIDVLLMAREIGFERVHAVIREQRSRPIP
jgi:biopolymer transport protein ExbD